MVTSILIYFLALLALTAFSFTQTDPAIIASPLYSLGQDYRWLTGTLFLLILILLFLSYRTLLSSRSRLIIFLPLILLLAYPAFLSHDIFSYAFDAKELVFYRVIPQLFPPASFPNDPWLAVNHWPTSPSRYGPVWTLLSLPPLFLGFPNLLPVSYAFKLLGALGFFLNLALFKKLAPKLNILIYAVNPFIVMETIASPHTDVWVTTFVLGSLVLLLKKRPRLAFAAFLSSIGVKIVSLPLIVPFILQSLFRLAPKTLFISTTFFAYLGSAIIIARWSINPWYLYLPITLSLLLWESKFWRYLAVSLSFAALLRYLPYFYLGFFDPHNKIRAILFLLALVPFLFWVLKEFRKRCRMEIL